MSVKLRRIPEVQRILGRCESFYHKSLDPGPRGQMVLYTTTDSGVRCCLRVGEASRHQPKDNASMTQILWLPSIPRLYNTQVVIGNTGKRFITRWSRWGQSLALKPDKEQARKLYLSAVHFTSRAAGTGWATSTRG